MVSIFGEERDLEENQRRKQGTAEREAMIEVGVAERPKGNWRVNKRRERKRKRIMVELSRKDLNMKMDNAEGNCIKDVCLRF